MDLRPFASTGEGEVEKALLEIEKAKLPKLLLIVPVAAIIKISQIHNQKEFSPDFSLPLNLEKGFVFQ